MKSTILKRNPIKNGYSKATVSANIGALRREGRSASQASAIALKNAREAWRKKHPTGPYPHHLKTQKKAKVRAKSKIKRKITKKRALKNPVTVDHLIIAQLRDDKIQEAKRKGLNVTTRLYFDGAGWTTNINYAVRYHDRGHARKIAQMVADSNLHNDRYRQIAVIMDMHHPKTKGGRDVNPVPLSKTTKIKKAVELFENFSGHSPKYVDTLDMTVPDVALKIGQCDGVLYTTIRDGKRERYVHEFKGKARPLLVVSFDGLQLLLLGGAYRFTERGIVDKR